jgi:hypothetical protein
VVQGDSNRSAVVGQVRLAAFSELLCVHVESLLASSALQAILLDVQHLLFLRRFDGDESPGEGVCQVLTSMAGTSCTWFIDETTLSYDKHNTFELAIHQRANTPRHLLIRFIQQALQLYDYTNLLQT